LIDSCVGKTAINHNRCLHLTAAEFLERVRAAHAQEEDFDAVVDEFEMGCPCKHPPLKSKGKQHLGTTTHKTAFGAGGQFCGMTVRQALERARSNNIILVGSGAVQLRGNADDTNAAPVVHEADDYESMDAAALAHQQFLEEALEAQALAQAVEAQADEDVSGIVAEED
jgi:hypothetical protein